MPIQCGPDALVFDAHGNVSADNHVPLRQQGTGSTTSHQGGMDMVTDSNRSASYRKRTAGPYAVLMALLLGPGCATLDKEECLVADWRLIGYQDGVVGKQASVVGEYREDCAEHGVVPDLDAYRAGRAEGLQQYCTPDNGFRLGEAGRGYTAVCPAGSDGTFRSAYDEGREIYLASSRVKSTHSQIHSKQQVISALEQDREDRLAEMIQDGITSEQRVLLLYKIHNIEKEIHSTEEEIGLLEHDLQHQQAHLDRLRHTSTY